MVRLFRLRLIRRLGLRASRCARRSDGRTARVVLTRHAPVDELLALSANELRTAAFRMIGAEFARLELLCLGDRGSRRTWQQHPERQSKHTCDYGDMSMHCGPPRCWTEPSILWLCSGTGIVRERRLRPLIAETGAAGGRAGVMA